MEGSAHATRTCFLILTPQGNFPGISGYALWKTGNALTIVEGNQPVSSGAVVADTTLISITGTTVTIAPNVIAQANMEVDGVLSLPNTPLYVNYGGIGTGVNLAGGKVMMSVAGAHGGQIVEGSFTAPVSGTVSLTFSAPGAAFINSMFYSGFNNVLTVTVAPSAPFTLSAQARPTTAGGQLPVGYNPVYETCGFGWGTRSDVAHEIAIVMCVSTLGAFTYSYLDASTSNQLQGLIGGTGIAWSMGSITMSFRVTP